MACVVRGHFVKGLGGLTSSRTVREFWRIGLDSWMGKDRRKESEAVAGARMKEAG